MILDTGKKLELNIEGPTRAVKWSWDLSGFWLGKWVRVGLGLVFTQENNRNWEWDLRQAQTVVGMLVFLAGNW